MIQNGKTFRTISEYDRNSTYTEGDLVLYRGGTYQALNTATGIVPDSTNAPFRKLNSIVDPPTITTLEEYDTAPGDRYIKASLLPDIIKRHVRGMSSHTNLEEYSNRMVDLNEFINEGFFFVSPRTMNHPAVGNMDEEFSLLRVITNERSNRSGFQIIYTLSDSTERAYRIFRSSDPVGATDDPVFLPWIPLTADGSTERFVQAYENVNNLKNEFIQSIQNVNFSTSSFWRRSIEPPATPVLNTVFRIMIPENSLVLIILRNSEGRLLNLTFRIRFGSNIPINNDISYNHSQAGNFINLININPSIILNEFTIYDSIYYRS